MIMKKFKEREIVKRWRTESPEFFVKIKTASTWLFVLGTLLTLFPPTTPIGLTITGLGTSGMVVSKLTKKDILENDLEDLKKQIEELKTIK